MLRKKYKKCKEEVVQSVKETGIETCCLKIELMATSKIKNHFIYEVCYLDQGELKTVSIVASSIIGVLECIQPYINKGLSEHQVSFMVGSEEAVASRLASSTYNPSKN
jgi:hypothetical protein